MPSSHLIPCRPLLLPSIFPSIGVFSNESTLCIRWPDYWCFSLSVCPSNENSGLISFRIDWFDLAVLCFSSLDSPKTENSEPAQKILCQEVTSTQSLQINGSRLLSFGGVWGELGTSGFALLWSSLCLGLPLSLPPFLPLFPSFLPSLLPLPLIFFPYSFSWVLYQ